MVIHKELFYTARDAAGLLVEGLTTVGGNAPSINANKVKTLVDAGALTNVSVNSRMQISGADLARFVSATRYVSAEEMLAVYPRIYRVSVTPRRDNVVYDHKGQLLRLCSGVDLSDDPASEIELGGWEGVWPTAESSVSDLLEDGVLLASLRGYVAPGHVRPVVAASRVGSRWYFHTEPADDNLESFVGGGLWIDVPDGPISNWVIASSNSDSASQSSNLDQLIEKYGLDRDAIFAEARRLIATRDA